MDITIAYNIVEDIPRLNSERENTQKAFNIEKMEKGLEDYWKMKREEYWKKEWDNKKEKIEEFWASFNIDEKVKELATSTNSKKI